MECASQRTMYKDFANDSLETLPVLSAYVSEVESSWAYIQRVPASNLSPRTGYPEVFLVYSVSSSTYG